MPLVVAEGALLEEILDLTFPVWNEGLSPRAYAQWHTAQARTAWARGRLDRMALVDDGAVRRLHLGVRCDQRCRRRWRHVPVRLP